MYFYKPANFPADLMNVALITHIPGKSALHTTPAIRNYFDICCFVTHYDAMLHFVPDVDYGLPYATFRIT